MHNEMWVIVIFWGKGADTVMGYNCLLLSSTQESKFLIIDFTFNQRTLSKYNYFEFEITLNIRREN